MHPFTVGTSVRFGWETFKKRPWFLVGVFFSLGLLLGVVSYIQSSTDGGATTYVFAVVRMILETLVYMGMYSIALKAHDNVMQVTWSDMWHPQSFWKYFFASLITGGIIVIGFLLLVVPGIIAIIMLMFVPYLVIDHGMGPFRAIKESFLIAKAHWLKILLLFLAVVGINILGFLALIVGLLVSSPISMLAVAHAYRTLSKTAPTPVA